MAVRKPLVQILGSVQEIPAGDTLSVGGGGTVISNVIASLTTIAADTSYIVVDYLDVQSDFDVIGNVGIL